MRGVHYIWKRPYLDDNSPVLFLWWTGNCVPLVWFPQFFFIFPCWLVSQIYDRGRVFFSLLIGQQGSDTRSKHYSFRTVTSVRGRQLLYLMRPRWKFGRQACNRQRRRIGLALIGKFSRTALFGLLYLLGLRANEWTIIAIFPLCIIHNTIYRCGVIQSAAAASFEGKQRRRKKTIQLIFAAGVHKKKKKNP